MVFPAILLVMATVAPILTYASRPNWVFANITVKIDIFTYIVFGLMIVNAIVVGILTAIRANKFEHIYSKKSYSVFRRSL